MHIHICMYVCVQFSLDLKHFLKLEKWIHLQARKVKALTRYYVAIII